MAEIVFQIFFFCLCMFLVILQVAIFIEYVVIFLLACGEHVCNSIVLSLRRVYNYMGICKCSPCAKEEKWAWVLISLTVTSHYYLVVGNNCTFLN